MQRIYRTRKCSIRCIVNVSKTCAGGAPKNAECRVGLTAGNIRGRLPQVDRFVKSHARARRIDSVYSSGFGQFGIFAIKNTVRNGSGGQGNVAGLPAKDGLGDRQRHRLRRLHRMPPIACLARRRFHQSRRPTRRRNSLRKPPPTACTPASSGDWPVKAPMTA